MPVPSILNNKCKRSTNRVFLFLYFLSLPNVIAASLFLFFFFFFFSYPYCRLLYLSSFLSSAIIVSLSTSHPTTLIIHIRLKCYLTTLRYKQQEERGNPSLCHLDLNTRGSDCSSLTTNL